MTHTCPVCKAHLWGRPFSGRLRCPRCGAEFRATVPLAYFQLLLFLFLALSLSLILILSWQQGWILVLLVLVIAALCWFLPRSVRLELDSRDLTVADGPPSKEMKLPYQHWSSEEPEPGARLTSLLTLLALLVVGLIVMVLLLVFS